MTALDKQLEQLQRINTYFNFGKYSQYVNEAEVHFNSGNNKLFEQAIKNIPSDSELFKSLIEKLKGKSVYKTLKLVESKSANDITKLKALFSLGTHATIEIEKGNIEYKALLPRIYEKIATIVYNN